MSEMTTIKVEKPTVDWLNSIKGLMEYAQSKKLTLNEALINIMATIDANTAIQNGTIDPEDPDEVVAYVQHKIDIFWEGEEDKPNYRIGTPRDWFISHLIDKQEKQKGRKYFKE